jgi:hypothetical protein
LHIQQQPSLLGTLQHIFGDDVCSGLKEIDFAQGKLRLSGFLSNSAQQLSSKALQYLCILHLNQDPSQEIADAILTIS